MQKRNRNTEVLEQDVEIYVRDSKQAIVDLNHLVVSWLKMWFSGSEDAMIMTSIGGI